MVGPALWSGGERSKEQPGTRCFVCVDAGGCGGGGESRLLSLRLGSSKSGSDAGAFSVCRQS